MGPAIHCLNRIVSGGCYDVMAPSDWSSRGGRIRQGRGSQPIYWTGILRSRLELLPNLPSWNTGPARPSDRRAELQGQFGTIIPPNDQSRAAAAKLRDRRRSTQRISSITDAGVDFIQICRCYTIRRHHVDRITEWP